MRAISAVAAVTLLAACGGRTVNDVSAPSDRDSGAVDATSTVDAARDADVPDAAPPARAIIPHCSGGDPIGAAMDGACAGFASEAERLSSGIVFVVDRSLSMADALPGASASKWDAAHAGISGFLAGPFGGDALSATVQFFASEVGAPCDPTAYSPVVELDPLSRVTAEELAAIDASFGSVRPEAPRRPTSAALTASLATAQHWIDGDPSMRASTLVLVTDGEDTACGARVADLEGIVAGAEDPAWLGRLRTCVIELGTGFDLGPVAEAGQTYDAFRITEGDIAGAISDAIYDCVYSVTPDRTCTAGIVPPPDDSWSYDWSRTVVAVSGLLVPPIAGPGACDSDRGGWFYDDPAAPTQISLCPCTCAATAGDPSLQIGFFCNP